MTEPKVALITTTINHPDVLEKYVRDWKKTHDEDLIVIVAGDVQTPAEVEAFVEVVLDGTYIGVSGVLNAEWRSEDVIGVRSIQRRNLALLHAIRVGADVIITIDDDNDPSDGHIDRLITELEAKPTELWYSESGWFNPCDLLAPNTWARGFPVSARDSFENMKAGLIENPTGRIAVVNGLTTGDPDVDAFERIANRPNADRVASFKNTVLAPKTWAPINTQNTAFRTTVAPLFQVLCGVGRYDDILASYVARAVLDSFEQYVSYGHPATYSARNAHDPWKDLEAELYGYRITPEFCEVLREEELVGDVVDRLADAYEAVRHLLPDLAREGNDAWLYDVDRALKEGGH